ncbi:unnamed protein product [Peniophora sp. CBMAI 1063]|nr:unnamed protein product [Peniophora sp. CBMAI 1063]
MQARARRELAAVAADALPGFFECRCIVKIRELRDVVEGLPRLVMEADDFGFAHTPMSTTRASDIDPGSLDPSDSANDPFFKRLWDLHDLATTVEGVDTENWPEARREKDALLLKLDALFVALANTLSVAYFTQATAVEAQTAAAAAEREANGPVYDTAPYFVEPMSSATPVASAVCVVIAASLLLLGLSEEKCRFLLDSFSFVLRLALRRTGMTQADISAEIGSIPHDTRTVVKNLGLRVKYSSRVCCPSCYACYPDHGLGSYPERCSEPTAPDGPPCGELLTRQRNIAGQIWTYPARRVVLQDLKAWIAWLLSRPGIVSALISEAALKEEMGDIWDAFELANFMGPDGKTHFMTVHVGEIRLVFALNIDGFNPFQMKEAGRKATTTAMYMVCLNLPPHLRYRVENMFLVGLIPGPGSPSTSQINSILSIVVEMLLEFWKDGVAYSRVPLHEAGVLVRLALFIVVCDTPAARQVSGFGAHNHTFFCPYCLLPYKERNNLNPKSWPPRALAAHKDCAQRWRDAPTAAEREKVFAESGVRYSALLRLPYWDPSRMTVIDMMHALFEGNLRRLCRGFWGMSASRDDGDGTFYDPVPLGPHDALLDELWLHVKTSSGDVLQKMRLDQLRALVSREGVPIPRLAGRNKGTKEPYIAGLIQWRIRMNWFSEDGERLGDLDETQVPRPISEILAEPHPSELASFKEYFAFAPESEYFSEFTKKVLLAGLTDAMQLGSEDPIRDDLKKLTKLQLLERVNRLEQGIVSPSGELLNSDPARFIEAVRTFAGRSRKRTSILGKRRLSQLWKDMERTVIPSWMGKAPRHIGDGKHRKVSADDWRSFVLVNLVITMGRLWGGSQFEGSRERALLDNLMHLVTATKVAAYRKMTTARVRTYVKHMKLWLEGLRELFPGISLESNQHLSLHLPYFLLSLGPTHAWRCFVFERWNYLLQLVNTNNHFGELESTMFHRITMQQRLRALVYDGGLRPDLQELEPIFERLLGKDNRGTMLNDILAFEPAQQPTSAPEHYRKFDASVFVPEVLRQLALLIQRDFRVSLRPNLLRPSERRSIDVGPVSYSANPPNCFVAVGPLSGEWKLARITRVFTHSFKVPETTRSVQRDYAIVQSFRSLEDADAKQDYFRQWPEAGGKLFYAELVEEVRVIPLEEIACHCCVIQWDDWPGIECPVFHALPGNRD